MFFAARHVQEKCREQQRGLYIVFVDLTKAFDSVSRTGLWMLLHRVGFPENVRYDGGISNLLRLKAKTKVHHILVRELLHADDCALVAHTEDVQARIDCLSNATKRYGLSISIKKTEVLLQLKPGYCYKEPAVTNGSENLRAVTKFCYLGGVLSNDCSIDLEIVARLAKASSTFGRLASRLWDKHDISPVTKVSVYQAAFLSVLLYGVETWTLYHRHIRQLDAFHMRCLRRLSGISWQDRIPNTEVLFHCHMRGIEAYIMEAHHRWIGHVVRMSAGRLPRALLYSKLSDGARKVGALKKCGITDFEALVSDRAQWKTAVKCRVAKFEDARIEDLRGRRRCRKERILAQGCYPCHKCPKVCHYQYWTSESSQSSRPQGRIKHIVVCFKT